MQRPSAEPVEIEDDTDDEQEADAPREKRKQQRAAIPRANQKPRLTAQQALDIQRLWEQTERPTYKEIADQLGLYWRTVKRCVARGFDLPQRTGTRAWSVMCTRAIGDREHSQARAAARRRRRCS